MPIPINFIQDADRVQQNAANDPSPQVRLIAGPGTGKSSAIEKRICWLLNQGVPTNEIYGVSFTRASARDLQERINAHCHAHGHAVAGNVRVSTLHSLALRILRAAGLLARYAADPLVLDNWELEEVFDAEFGQEANIRSKSRREEIRYFYEAHWSTGVWNPPNYLPPDPPISKVESNQFIAFHQPRTQLYSCVLPGEIVRQCVQEIAAGLIDPVQLLQVRHLIVDEFQDLLAIEPEYRRTTMSRYG